VTLACNQQLPATSTPLVTRFVPTTPAATATRQWNALVADPFVNVRASPEGTVIGTLRAGDAVEIIECANHWCRIEEPSGWIWQGCLSDPPAGLGCQAR
jgi:SH3-like domain-containing protein